jgi:hypothetical protein
MRRLLAPALLLALAACALPQQRSRTFSPYAPLRAYITSTATGAPLFQVNRPAYVAMFYIAPGRGVSMLYPGFGSGSLSGRVFAGSHFASTRLSNRESYLPTRGSFGGPTYYFLIASDRPLNIEQFGTFGHGLQSRLGTRFASLSPYTTMESLARLSLPSLENDGSWTTDMYVSWPSVIYTDPGERRVLVRCGQYAMYVRVGYVQAVRSVICDPSAEERPELPESPDGDRPVVRPDSREALPADTDDADERRPVSPQERQAIRERIASSSQLAAPTAREAMRLPVDDFGRVNSRARPTYGGPGYDGGRSEVGARSPRPASRGAADVGSSSSGRAAAAPSARPSSGGADSSPSSRGSSSGGGSSSSGRTGRARVD